MPKYSYQIHAAESMTDEKLIRDTVVTVLADSFDEAVQKVKILLGDERKRKTVFWPGYIAELMQTGSKEVHRG